MQSGYAYSFGLRTYINDIKKRQQQNSYTTYEEKKYHILASATLSPAQSTVKRQRQHIATNGDGGQSRSVTSKVKWKWPFQRRAIARAPIHQRKTGISEIEKEEWIVVISSARISL